MAFYIMRWFGFSYDLTLVKSILYSVCTNYVEQMYRKLVRTCFLLVPYSFLACICTSIVDLILILFYSNKFISFLPYCPFQI